MAGETSRDLVAGSRDDLLHRAEDRMPEVVTIAAAAVDPANGLNNGGLTLRKGLVLCKVTTTGKYMPFLSTATDGRQLPATAVVLAYDTRMNGTDDMLSAAYYDAKLKPLGPKFTTVANATAFNWNTAGVSGRLVIVDTRVV